MKRTSSALPILSVPNCGMLRVYVAKRNIKPGKNKNTKLLSTLRQVLSRIKPYAQKAEIVTFSAPVDKRCSFDSENVCNFFLILDSLKTHNKVF